MPPLIFAYILTEALLKIYKAGYGPIAKYYALTSLSFLIFLRRAANIFRFLEENYVFPSASPIFYFSRKRYDIIRVEGEIRLGGECVCSGC